MTSALASRTSSSKDDRIRPIRDPSLEPPRVFQRVGKEPGSKKLVLGEWVTVNEGDDDAIGRDRKAKR